MKTLGILFVAAVLLTGCRLKAPANKFCIPPQKQDALSWLPTCYAHAMASEWPEDRMELCRKIAEEHFWPCGDSTVSK